MNCISCPRTVSKGSKSGRCLSCANIIANADPERRARSSERMRLLRADPKFCAEVGRRSGAARRRKFEADPEAKARASAQGREHYDRVLNSPEVRARNQSPEVRARAGKARTNTVLGWCPPEYRDEYRHFVNKKGIPAKEARTLIEEMIAAEARRGIAKIDSDQRARRAREKAQAY